MVVRGVGEVVNDPIDVAIAGPVPLGHLLDYTQFAQSFRRPLGGFGSTADQIGEFIPADA